MQSLIRQSEILLSRNNADCVGVALTTAPALNTDDGLALLENTQLDGLADTPLETTVDILLPVGATEVRLGLREMEGIHATVQVRVARGRLIASDHDDRTDRAVLGDDTGRFAACGG
jgi:hypothetical protein